MIGRVFLGGIVIDHAASLNEEAYDALENLCIYNVEVYM